MCVTVSQCVFFFNDTATTEIYTLSLHDALPILWLFATKAALGPIASPTPNSMSMFSFVSARGRFGSVCHTGIAHPQTRGSPVGLTVWSNYAGSWLDELECALEFAVVDDRDGPIPASEVPVRQRLVLARRKVRERVQVG